MKGSHMFSWSHEENDKKSTINIPVSIAKCVNSGNGIPRGKLVCNECEKPLSQQYTCDCGKMYTVREIDKRYDPENEVVYPYAEKKQYLQSTAKNEVNVIGEIPLIDVTKNLEFVDGFHELYTNKNKKIIDKIHKWLYKHQKALVVSFGYRGDSTAGVIIPGDKKLLLVKFRDHRNIRPPKQQDLEPLDNESKDVFAVLSEDKTPDLYEEYIEKLKSGKKISIEKVAKTDPEMEVTSVGFLDD